MNTVTQIRADSSIIFLPCSDIGKTIGFYTEMIGLTIAQKQGESSVIFDTGYGYIGFVQYSDERPLLSGPKGVCISLNCKDKEDVDQHYLCYVERGGKVQQIPSRHPKFPVYSCFVADPDDYTVEFQIILSE